MGDGLFYVKKYFSTSRKTFFLSEDVFHYFFSVEKSLYPYNRHVFVLYPYNRHIFVSEHQLYPYNRHIFVAERQLYPYNWHIFVSEH